MRALIRNLTPREKNILRLAAVLAVLMIVNQVLPAVTASYRDRSARIEAVRDDIAREQRLADEAEQWQLRRETVEEQRPLLDSQVFEANATPMLAAAIQRLVRQYAAESGITITSASLAQAAEADGWLKLEQRFAFTLTDQNALLTLLQRLENSRPYLGVVDFKIQRSRNQFSGEITVAGFSRTTGAGS